MWREGMLLVVVACSAPSRIEPGTCGNAVLEEGEDCDRFVDPAYGPGTACEGCRYVCSGATCPSGWGCGADGICRFASGAYEPGALVAEPTRTLHLGDVSGDDRIDLVGTASARIWVRLGTPDLRFTDGYSFPAREDLGPIDVADVDRDGRLDGVIPVPRSFFVAAGGADGLEPIAQATFELAPKGGLVSVPIRTDADMPFQQALALYADEFPAGDLLLITVFTGDTIADPVPIPDRTVYEIRGLAVGRVRLAPGVGEDVALSFAGEDRVRFFRTWRDAGVNHVAPAGEAIIPEVPERAGISFGDVEGDGDLDLFVPVVPPRPRARLDLAVLRGDGAGGFAPLEILFEGVGWPAAIGDLDGDGAADFVLEDGIYVNGGGQLDRRAEAAPGLRIARAAIADLNGDERSDVMWALADTPRVNLLIANPLGRFTSFPFETEGEVTGLASGDFDGDLVGDVALSEAAAGGDLVSVFFGDTAGPFRAPAPVSRFESIDRIGSALIDAPGVPLDGVSDLIVTSRAHPGSAAYEPIASDVMFGNSARILLSALDLGADPARLLAGRFDLDDHVDVLAVTREPLQGTRVQIVFGRGSARYHAIDRRLLRCAPLDNGTFEPNGAVWAVGDVDRDGRDDVVGVRGGALFVGELDHEAPEASLRATVVPLGAGAGALASIQLRDLDRDGSLDLLVVYDGGGVVIHWNEAGSFDPERRVALSEPWRDVAALNADGDADLELAVVSDAGVFAVELAGRTPGPAARIPGVPGGERIWSGDLDSDGLDDLLVASGDELQVLLATPAAGAP